MQPIAPEAIDGLIQDIQEDDGVIHPFWFFSIEGVALWSQDHIGVPLISGMSVKRPGFSRVVSMEDCVRHGITIIRVEVSEDSLEPNIGDDIRFYSSVNQPGLRPEYPDPEGERWMDEEGTKAIREYFGKTVIDFDLEDALRGPNPALCPYVYHPILVSLDDEETEQYMAITTQLARFMVTLQKYLNEDILSAPVWWKLDDDVNRPGVSILYGRNRPPIA